MTHAIECRRLVKRYDGKPPVEAVRGLDLTAETGECFGLLGPNGAGKTKTLEIPGRAGRADSPAWRRKHRHANPRERRRAHDEQTAYLGER